MNFSKTNHNSPWFFKLKHLAINIESLEYQLFLFFISFKHKNLNFISSSKNFHFLFYTLFL